MARTKFGSHLAFVADQLISGFVMAPLTVGYWRGTWQLIQQYMFPDNLGKSSWISLAIGNCGILLLALFQVPIQKLLKRDSLRTPSDVIAWLLGYHVYNYVMAFCIVNLWRGTWDLWNFYTGTEPWSNACCVSIGSYVYSCGLCVNVVKHLSLIQSFSARTYILYCQTDRNYIHLVKGIY